MPLSENQKESIELFMLMGLTQLRTNSSSEVIRGLREIEPRNGELGNYPMFEPDRLVLSQLCGLRNNPKKVIAQLRLHNDGNEVVIIQVPNGDVLEEVVQDVAELERDVAEYYTSIIRREIVACTKIRDNRLYGNVVANDRMGEVGRRMLVGANLNIEGIIRQNTVWLDNRMLDAGMAAQRDTHLYGQDMVTAAKLEQDRAYDAKCANVQKGGLMAGVGVPVAAYGGAAVVGFMVPPAAPAVMFYANVVAGVGAGLGAGAVAVGAAARKVGRTGKPTDIFTIAFKSIGYAGKMVLKDLGGIIQGRVIDSFDRGCRQVINRHNIGQRTFVLTSVNMIFETGKATNENAVGFFDGIQQANKLIHDLVLLDKTRVHNRLKMLVLDTNFPNGGEIANRFIRLSEKDREKVIDSVANFVRESAKTFAENLANDIPIDATLLELNRAKTESCVVM